MKPSPIQAQILRILAEEHQYQFYAEMMNGRVWGSPYWSYATNNKSRPPILRATAAALIKNKWVTKPGPHTGYTISDSGKEVLATLKPEDFLPGHSEYSAKDILTILKQRHPAPEWVWFEELRGGTGWSIEQRIDAWALNTWPSKNFLSIAYEVKISRSDLLKELSHPDKHKFAFQISQEFYFVLPEKMMSKDELPPDCGLIYIKDDKATTVVKATNRKIERPPWYFVSALARRLEHANS